MCPKYLLTVIFGYCPLNNTMSTTKLTKQGINNFSIHKVASVKKYSFFSMTQKMRAHIIVEIQIQLDQTYGTLKVRALEAKYVLGQSIE